MKRKTKRFINFFLTMILAVAAVLGGFITTGSSEVNAADPISGLEFTEEQVMEIGGTTYRFQAYWANVQSDSTKSYNYDEDGTLVMHPIRSDDKPEAQIGIRFSVEGEMIDEHPVGSIAFRIPASVFKDWNGNYTGELSTQIPKAPETSGTSQFNYTIDESTGDVIISNWAAITGAMTFSAVISFAANPFNVPGGWIDESGNYAGDYFQGTTPIKVNIDTDGSGGQDMQQDLNVEYHTKITGSVKKQVKDYYYVWQKAWGEKPADAEDYFYVCWWVNYRVPQYNPTQPFFVDMEETDTDGGEIVGYFVRRNTEYPEATNPTSFTQTKNRLELATTSGTTGRWSQAMGDWWILMRYPYTLIDEAIANGVDVEADGYTIHNTAEVTEYWKSGHEVTRECTAETNIPFIFGNGGGGTFSKIHSGGANRVMVGDTSGQSKLQLGWNVLLNNNFHSWAINHDSISPNVKWNEETGTYYDAGQTISIEEGTFQMSGQKNTNGYLWSTDHETLNDEDYYIDSTFMRVNVYDAASSHGMWSITNEIWDLARSPEFDLYIRQEGESEYKFYTKLHAELNKSGLKKSGWYVPYNDEANGGTPFNMGYYYTPLIKFPENTVGFKVVGHSDAYKVSIELRPRVYIKPTKHVLDQVNSDLAKNAATYFKNIAYADYSLDDGTVIMNHVASNNGENSALRNIIQIGRNTIGDSLLKTSSEAIDDPVNMVQYTTERIDVRKSSSSGDFMPWYFEKEGVIYDLLPYGTYMDPTSITLGYTNAWHGARVAVPTGEAQQIRDYTLELIENWENSNRTMLKLSYTVPNSISDNVTGSDSSIVFTYRLYNPYSNIRDMGINTVDSAAYVNMTDVQMAPGNYTKVSRIRDSAYFQSLKDQYGEKIMFAEAPINYKEISVIQSGLTKSSKAQMSYRYSDEDYVITGKPYDYMLSFTNLADIKTKDIVLYDVLEAGNKELPSEWQGTFDYIDISSIRKKFSFESTVQCDPKIYYSTTPREQLLTDDRQMKDEYEDLTNPVWTDTEPADKSTITAVAVDCRKNTDGTDFILGGGSTMAAYVHMVAPLDASLKGKKAVNSVYSETDSYSLYASPNGFTTRLTNSAAMVLDTYEPEISKESDPAGGTEAAPAQIETGIDLSYTIHLTNTSAIFPYKNTIVTDDVPEGMTIHTDQIKAYTDDAAKAKVISEYEGVTLTSSGQHLEFLVDELKAGKSIHFIIPVTVTAEEGVLVNEPVVKEIDDIDLDVHGNKVVHEVNSKITIHIFKTDNAGTTPLPGTQFRLTGTETDITATTNGEGIATFEEIKNGEYLLKEVKAASGYQLSGTTWTVTVANGTATIKDPEGNVLGSTLNSDEEQVFQVKDSEPIQLLNTGGYGTRVFTIMGSLIMLIALYCVKKKKSEE